MLVRFWGVRGSTPTPQSENLRYGGNTSCVEVRVNGSTYIFDCGTGFRVLGHHLQRETANRPLAAHVFVSHFHWDHIQGIPFCAPLYGNPDNHFIFHSSNHTRTLKRVMEEKGIKHVAVDPMAMDDVLEGQRMSYGERVFPRYRFDRADYVLSLGADFLGNWGSSGR